MELSGEQLDEVGNTELLTWFVMWGAIGNRRGELLSYQPTSHHGHGVFRFIPDRGRRGREHEELPLYGGFEFKGAGYEFYKYPEPATFPLNLALHRLRNDDQLRARFVRDMDGGCREFGLTDAQAKALKTLETDAVVAEGAHGILAITTMLALQLAQRDAEAGQTA